MSFESTAIKQTEFRVGYSDRRFSLSGSAIDQSVVGAIETAKGAWEPHVTRLMSRLIRPDDVCFDIGANVGVYTLVMSDLAAQGGASTPSSRRLRISPFCRKILPTTISSMPAPTIWLWATRPAPAISIICPI